MSSPLKDRIQTDLNAARKGRDKARTLVLSTLLSEVKNKEINARIEVDDEAVLQVVTKAIKQRRDASEQMRAADRHELADLEDAQAAVLRDYLPEGMSEDEVRAIVRETDRLGRRSDGGTHGPGHAAHSRTLRRQGSQSGRPGGTWRLMSGP